jgi:DNA-directed RNA polymerase subunit RPC12/RpoP
MKDNIKKLKIYTCASCNKESEIIGIIQKESHFYSLNINTNQMEHFHGDENVESQEFFCINCDKRVIESDLKGLI